VIAISPQPYILPRTSGFPYL